MVDPSAPRALHQPQASRANDRIAIARGSAKKCWKLLNQRKHWIIGKFGLPPFKRPLASAADTLRFRGQNLGGTAGKWIFIPTEVLSHHLDVASSRCPKPICTCTAVVKPIQSNLMVKTCQNYPFPLNHMDVWGKATIFVISRTHTYPIAPDLVFETHLRRVQRRECVPSSCGYLRSFWCSLDRQMSKKVEEFNFRTRIKLARVKDWISTFYGRFSSLVWRTSYTELRYF